MTYITVKEASEKWGISTRRVCVLCSNGQIPGAVKKSKVWMIPINAMKPEDGRKGVSENRIEPLILLFNPYYFERNTSLVPTNEEKAICEIQEKYLCGNLEEAYAEINRLLNKSAEERYLYVIYIIKLLVAHDLGDSRSVAEIYTKMEALLGEGKYRASRLIYNIYKNSQDALETFCIMNEPAFYELIPIITLLNGKRFINDMIQCGKAEDITGLEIACRELEEKECPAISAYFHLYLAVYCNAMSMTELREKHIKRAVEILLPRGWYTPLAEYSATLDMEFIKAIDKDAYTNVMKLSKQIINNYIKVGIFNVTSSKPKYDTGINVQIAFMIAHGKTNNEIAETLGLTLYKLKQHIDDICQLFGVESKREIRAYLLQNFFV